LAITSHYSQRPATKVSIDVGILLADNGKAASYSY
jgi:hypothetical protein